MALNLTVFKKSLDTLDRSIEVASSTKNLGKDVEETLRAGVIQNFEVAYEQCWKMMQRWLKENQGSDEVGNPRTRKDLFRIAARQGLISSPIPWFTYGEARNKTSHTYNETEAAAVFQITSDFLKDARFLEGQLESLND